jgi:hypothetical protein
MRLRIVTGLAAAAVLALTIPAPASASVTQAFTAVISGTPVTSPVNGVLYVYDDATALHHTRSVEYYQHDGYSKTVNLVAAGRRYGVILKEEDIENACMASLTDGSVNPAGGYHIGCGGHLAAAAMAYPLGGDLTGRYCRVPPAGQVLHCPAMPRVHVNESASGSGRYLLVGNKDHGAMLEIDYYANVAGVNVEVDVILPGSMPALVTRVVLLPQGTSPPHAVLVLQ